MTLKSDVRRGPDPQPESRRAVNSRNRERVGDDCGDLAQRCLGRARARPALGGGAGRHSGAPAALKRRKSLRPSGAAAAALRQVFSVGSERGCGLAVVLKDTWVNFQSLCISTAPASSAVKPRHYSLAASRAEKIAFAESCSSP